MLIAGGGIAGLAAALALARQGRSSVVLEQAASFREIGAGVQLGPNALRRLTALGLRDQVEAVVSWPQQVLMRDALSGKVLNRLPLDADFRQRYREGYATIHRADLLSLLLQACRERPLQIDLRNNLRVETISEAGDRVRVTDQHGRPHEGEALIGADGLWSRVRAHVIDDQAPRFSGDVALRALIANDMQAREVTLWMGPHLHVVAYPVRRGAFLNLVAISQYPSGGGLRGWETPAPQQTLERFQGQHSELSALLQQVPGWTAWPLLDRDPVRHWSRGRVGLIGDAAHPSLQYLAQGACLALEDAVALAQLLADPQGAGTPQAAFTRLAEQRHARAARMVRTTRRLARVYHASGPLRWGRNLTLGLMPTRLTREMMAWIYDH